MRCRAGFGVVFNSFAKSEEAKKFMWYRSPFVRLSLSLVMLACTILVALDLGGFVPSVEGAYAELRGARAEALALRVVSAAERRDLTRVARELERAVEESDTLVTAGLRSRAGVLLTSTRGHAQSWDPRDAPQGADGAMTVPIRRAGKPWAQLELRYDAGGASSFLGNLMQRPLVRIVGAFAFLSFLAYAFLLRRTLRHLDPSTVIPPRVKATLDLMTEGVLLIDREECIILANEAFALQSGLSSSRLTGRSISELDWRVPGSLEPAQDLPWARALRESASQQGVALALPSKQGMRMLMATSGPVGDGNGPVRGAIATFDDITLLEDKSRQLEDALAELEKSRDEIQLHNDELRVLAKCDPLTGVSNRRSFMSQAESQFESASEVSADFSIIMADIDHFKRVNDEHGHLIGDEVIQSVAQELLANSDRDSVCRYGGEEFCLLLRDRSADEARAVAERMRRAIAADGFAAAPVTASFGISSFKAGARDVAELIEMADQALYASKDRGRDRVTHWDDLDG
jgi:diguanylate cyclase (GGDEF)-like protein/PAS domain S-box-containing protein